MFYIEMHIFEAHTMQRFVNFFGTLGPDSIAQRHGIGLEEEQGGTQAAPGALWRWVVGTGLASATVAQRRGSTAVHRLCRLISLILGFILSDLNSCILP